MVEIINNYMNVFLFIVDIIKDIYNNIILILNLNAMKSKNRLYNFTF